MVLTIGRLRRAPPDRGPRHQIDREDDAVRRRVIAAHPAFQSVPDEARDIVDRLDDGRDRRPSRDHPERVVKSDQGDVPRNLEAENDYETGD